MEKENYPVQELKTCRLLDYLNSRNIPLDLLDIIKGAFMRNHNYTTFLICVEDETVVILSGSMLSNSNIVDADTTVSVQPYADWRDITTVSFALEYDRNRFARSTELSTLCRKVIEHQRYSFVAHKLDGDNVESVLKYDFSALDHDAHYILAIQQEITHSLEHDILTGGLNRSGLMRELQQKFKAITGPDQLSLLFFNIFNFRLVNEQYGDEMGDKMLQYMYTSMVYSDLHPISYARIESDKFVCLVKNENLDMDTITKLCHQEYDVEGNKIPFACKCGIYHVLSANETAVNACNYAKLASTHVKDHFLQPWMVFEPSMQSSYFSDAEILRSLDDAIANHEFVPYFQPIVNTQTGRMEMAEALVRWISPTKGMISPAIFIPVLEQHGGLSRIDMLMEQYIYDMQCKRYQEGLPIVPIDINLSWVDFADNQLLDQLYAHIVDPALPTDMMRYEITESALAEIAENRYDVLDFFKIQHVKLLIDDFGQAYSFGTMKDVDFTIIKIDKSMIDQIGSSRKVNLLIETMINMFHKMHAKVVAEGVETELQVEFLKRIGCDYIQGFRFFRPMDEKAFTELLAHNEENRLAALSESGAQVVKEDYIAPTEHLVEPKNFRSRMRRVVTSFKTMKWSDIRSTALIVSICALVALVVYLTTFRMVNNLVTVSCDELTSRDIDKIKLHVDLELNVAQEALQSFSTAVFQDGLNIPKTEDQIYEQMENFLRSTPFISGIVAGFEDSVFPEYADSYGFGPLVRNFGDTLVRYQVGEIRDFRNTKEWYAEALKQGQSRWSAPFFSEEGDIIIDYSIPLKNNEGKVVGVVACDLSISRLRQVVEDIKPYPTSIVMVMLEDLTFVIHPDKGYPMHKSLPVFLKERGIEPDTTLMNALKQGEVGKLTLAPLGEELFLYYDVIGKAGYRLLIESPSSEVYSSLDEISHIMKSIGGVGLASLLFILAFMIYENKKRERKVVERNMEILREAAEIDGLTGIFNRSTGEGLIAEQIRSNVPGILAILDCDKFKLVNDNYGHSTGDELLKRLSETLKNCFGHDIVLRLGGDEFAIFCQTEKSVADFKLRVQLFFSEIRKIRIEGMGDYSPSVSMGAAAYHGEEDLDFEHLYKMADRLLYESKHSEGCTLTITEG